MCLLEARSTRLKADGVHPTACPDHQHEVQASEDLEASDTLGQSDILPELETDTCLPDTAATGVNATTQAPSFDLTAACSGAVAWGPSSSEQEVSRTTSIL